MDKDTLPVLAHTPTRESIMQLEAVMTKLPQVELQLIEHWAHGAYARELHIPAGTLLTGKIHKHSQINVLAKGRMQLATEFGTGEVSAPAVIVGKAGDKRAGLALEDSIWVEFVPTTHTTAEAVEKEAIVDSYKSYEERLECHG